MIEYIPRIADKALRDGLKKYGAVLLHGPRWCGKTTTAMQAAACAVQADKTVYSEMSVQNAEDESCSLLNGPAPRLVDDWDNTPELRKAVTEAVDDLPGQLILTSSSDAAAGFDSADESESSEVSDGTEGTNCTNGTKGTDGNRDFDIDGYDVSEGTAAGMSGFNCSAVRSLVDGKIGCINMWTLSLYESGESTGTVSLGELFNAEFNAGLNAGFNTELSGVSTLTLKELSYIVSRGGWPETIGKEPAEALLKVREYYGIIADRDIIKSDFNAKNHERARLIMRSYAKLLGMQSKNLQICNDVKIHENTRLDLNSVKTYTEALKRIYVISELYPWYPAIKSRAAVRTIPIRHYTDPSLAVAARRMGPADLTDDEAYFARVFESMCLRDLRIYTDVLGGSVYHYIDSNGVEGDAVIVLPDGRWACVDSVLGPEYNENAARKLLKFKNTIDTDKMGEPSFLMILSGTEEKPYRREDGIIVVPVTCLKY